MAKVEVTAILLDERRPPNCDNFAICRCRLVIDGVEQKGPDSEFKAVGNAEEGELRQFLTYRWYGTWHNDPKWGRQLKFETFTPAKPHGRAGVIRYLQQCDGIGEKTAVEIWNAFNADAVRMCREHPDIVADKIRRLNLSQCREISEQLKELQSLEDTNIELIDLLDGKYIPKSVAREAVKLFGNKAAELFRRNPYLLMRFRGVGFDKADNLYCELGLPPDRLKRQVYCFRRALDKSDDTWVHETAAKSILNDRFGQNQARLDDALALGTRAKKFSVKRWCGCCKSLGRTKQPDLFFGDTMIDLPCQQCQGTGGGRWVAVHQRAVNERIIAEKVAILLKAAPQWPDAASVTGISDHQRAELAKAFAGAIGVFTGGPGSGKSHTSAAAVKSLIQCFGIENIAIASPTNKAAVRMTECLQANKIDLRATSIHRLLRVEKVDGGGWQFVHSRRNTLPYRVILLDEFGMVGTDLGACLFDAIAPGTLVLCIGDIGQLLPISHGALLRDFISAGIPTGRLMEPQRNAGDIVFACADIQNGQRFRESETIDLDCRPPRNFKFIAARSPDEQVEKLFDLLSWAKSIGLDPVWDCQVMSAVNRNSKVSRETLNDTLQARFTPAEQSRFRPDDKVICDDNGFYDIPDSDDEQAFIAKGEFGRVLQVTAKTAVVRFDGENRTVVVPLRQSKRSFVPADNGQGGDGCPIQLAYSCTVHRMQGSECKLAIPMIDESAGAKWLGCRELFYTAISRGKLLTRPIGSRSTADQMCRKVMIGKRKTFLVELIQELAR